MRIHEAAAGPGRPVARFVLAFDLAFVGPDSQGATHAARYHFITTAAPTRLKASVVILALLANWLLRLVGRVHNLAAMLTRAHLPGRSMGSV
jgi:hypothetical protein